MKYPIPTLNQLLQPQVQDKLALAAAVLLTILLGHGLANLTWTLLPQSQQAAPPPPAVNMGAERRDSSTPNYGQVAQLHLFGQAQAEDVARSAPIDAPDTRLNLTLRGILYNSEAGLARAIIAAPGREDQHYRAGQQVSNGVTIDRIFSDRVILLREGQYETLRLPEDSLEVAGGNNSAGAARSSARSQPQVASQPMVGSPQELNQYRQQLVERPNEASRYLRAEPVNRNGGLAGFRVSPGSDRRLFELAGLEAGDIVTSVNGVELDQLDKGFLALEELAGSSELTLSVMRGGQQQTIRLQLQ